MELPPELQDMLKVQSKFHRMLMLHAAGISTDEIADYLEFDRENVRDFFAPPIRRYGYRAGNKADHIEALLKSSPALSNQEVADQLKVAPEYVQVVRLRRGLPPFKREPAPPQTDYLELLKVELHEAASDADVQRIALDYDVPYAFAVKFAPKLKKGRWPVDK